MGFTEIEQIFANLNSTAESAFVQKTNQKQQQSTSTPNSSSDNETKTPNFYNRRGSLFKVKNNKPNAIKKPSELRGTDWKIASNAVVLNKHTTRVKEASSKHASETRQKSDLLNLKKLEAQLELRLSKERKDLEIIQCDEVSKYNTRLKALNKHELTTLQSTSKKSYESMHDFNVRVSNLNVMLDRDYNTAALPKPFELIGSDNGETRKVWLTPLFQSWLPEFQKRTKRVANTDTDTDTDTETNNKTEHEILNELTKANEAREKTVRTSVTRQRLIHALNVNASDKKDNKLFKKTMQNVVELIEISEGARAKVKTVRLTEVECAVRDGRLDKYYD